MRTLNPWAVLALSLLVPVVAPAVTTSDPVDDVLSFASDPAFDVTEVAIIVTGTTVEITLTFDPTAGTPANLVELGGYVDFDLDRNLSTGCPSNIDQFAAPPFCSMGVDYTLEFWQFAGLAQLWKCDSSGPVEERGLFDVAIDANTVRVVMDRTVDPAENGLPVTGAFDYACVPGNLNGPTDRVPNNSTPLRFAYTGDVDLDGDVDLADFNVLQGCFNGPNRPPLHAGCEIVDFDQDTDVDLTDFGVFQRCFNGPNRAPAPECPD